MLETHCFISVGTTWNSLILSLSGLKLFPTKNIFYFGLFYRPPNANALYRNNIEDSIHMAIDTGLRDIVIVGDF